MVKNKLEKKFSASLKADPDLWGMKLHNNMLAHQTTPADYIIDYEKDSKITLILVECKQVTLQDGKGRFAFKRMKQMHDLLAFENIRPLNHKSYVCLSYLDNRWENSEVYIIPAYILNEIIEFETEKGNMSLNRQNAYSVFGKYKAKYTNQNIALDGLKS